MNSVDNFWRVRVRDYIQTIRRYLKYMLNDHLLFVIIFAGGAAIYYYPQWIETLDESFPVAAIMAILLGLVISASPVITLLKPADAVYLLPLETKLTGYFRKGILFSFLTQAYFIVLVLAASMPMYTKVTGKEYSSFFLLLLLTLGLKLWNLLIHWWMLKTTFTLIYDWIIRFAITGTLLYFILRNANFIFIVATLLILICFTFYLWRVIRVKRINWELLIEKEQARMQAFYHIANMFTDVPHIKSKVKRRKWLDPLFSIISYDQKQTYRFLFARTIIRSGEFSGLIIRLTIIALIVIFFIKNIYVVVGVSLLFLYLTGFQLFPLLHRHDFIIWPKLYPISVKQKQTAFLRLLMIILLFQGLLFSFAAWINGDIVQGGIVLGLACAFSILFVKGYAPSRIKKLEGTYQ